MAYFSDGGNFICCKEDTLPQQTAWLSNLDSNIWLYTFQKLKVDIVFASIPTQLSFNLEWEIQLIRINT